MTHPLETTCTTSCQKPVWLGLPVVPFDILATLSQDLGTAWSVQREIDYNGEASILVMATGDRDDAMPTFILYEENGSAHVASVTDDKWQSQFGFVSAHAAVEAIVAQATCVVRNLPASI